MKFPRTLITIQSLYYLITGLWPIIDIDSFMIVTGYKTDIWLVKTFGAILIPISISLFLNRSLQTNFISTFGLGAGTAVSLIVADFYYSLTDVIPDVYLLDGIAEMGFLAGWIYGAVVIHKNQKNPR